MSGIVREIVIAFRGEMRGNRGFIPGPGHSRNDRCIAVWPSATDPDDYTCHSYSPAHDWREIRDYIDSGLGRDRDRWRSRAQDDPIASMRRRAARRAAEEAERADLLNRQRRALALWNESRDPTGTTVETYLNSRGLDLPDDIAGRALRYHPRIPFGPGSTAPAMVALMCDVLTGEPKAIHRTALTPGGQKIGRKMLGPVAGTAVLLDAEEFITTGLAIGEGVESCLAARHLGIRPTWALGSADAIRFFPVLPGIETLTVLAENDVNGANLRACREVGTRWHRAGQAVEIITPKVGNDMNDALREGAAA